MTESNRNPGEDKAWELLAQAAPGEITRAAQADYDPSSASYTVQSFGMDFTVSVKTKTMRTAAPEGELLLQEQGYFFRLAILWYLVSARDLPFSGRLVRLQDIKGGDIYAKGSHVLPLDGIARRFGRDPSGLIMKGASLGGEPAGLGDASVTLHPFPRIQAVLILWVEDDEFPARADLLFDASCDLQAPADIVWSIALVTTLMFLKE